MSEACAEWLQIRFQESNVAIHYAETGNLLSLDPKIHGLSTDAKIPGGIMLLPDKSEVNFSTWKDLQQHSPRLIELFSQGAGDLAKAQQRYEDLMEGKAPSVACLLNILTACRDIHLPQSTVLDYFRQFVWDSPAFPVLQDRFYVYADPALVTQVRLANAQGVFSDPRNPTPASYTKARPPATSKYSSEKQTSN